MPGEDREGLTSCNPAAPPKLECPNLNPPRFAEPWGCQVARLLPLCLKTCSSQNARSTRAILFEHCAVSSTGWARLVSMLLQQSSALEPLALQLCESITRHLKITRKVESAPNLVLAGIRHFGRNLKKDPFSKKDEIMGHKDFLGIARSPSTALLPFFGGGFPY